MAAPIHLGGEKLTAASSLPALLLYHLHEAPSSPFAANNAFVRRIGLPQGRQIEKRAAISANCLAAPNPNGGEKLTAASSLPALLLYHLHEAPSSPFAANNAFARRIGLPQGRSIGTSRHPARTVWRLHFRNGGEKLYSSVIPSCPLFYHPRQTPSSPRLCSQFIH